MSNVFKLERKVELCPESKVIAEKELRETPERVRDSLARIRQLLKENPDLYFGDDDEYFTIFLRRCKWYPESALKMMRSMAEFKRDYKELLSGLRPEDVKESMLKNCNVTFLPKRDHKNRRITICHYGGVWDTSKISTDEIFRWTYLFHLLLLVEPESQVNGHVSILDYHDLGWAQIKTMTPSWAKRQSTFMQEVSPTRQKETHVVRQPTLYNMLWNVSKHFVGEKTKQRMFIHGTKYSSLHKFIPPAYLPAEYGGELPPLSFPAEQLYQVILDNRDIIETFDSFGFVNKS